MEQNANALPKVTLGQYKGLEFTRRVRPVSDKAVEADIGWILRASWTAHPSRKAKWKM